MLVEWISQFFFLFVRSKSSENRTVCGNSTVQIMLNLTQSNCLCTALSSLYIASLSGLLGFPSIAVVKPSTFKTSITTFKIVLDLLHIESLVWTTLRILSAIAVLKYQINKYYSIDKKERYARDTYTPTNNRPIHSEQNQNNLASIYGRCVFFSGVCMCVRSCVRASKTIGFYSIDTVYNSTIYLAISFPSLHQFKL